MEREQLEAILSSEMFVNRPDFPRAGFNFPDINNLLNNHPEIFARIIDYASAIYSNEPIDKIASLETYGSYFSAPIAYRLGKGIIPIKKRGKLPPEVIRERYDMVYAEGNEIEMQVEAVQEGDRVVVIDDFLASGGTFFATKRLIERQGGNVTGAFFAVEIPSMGGHEKLVKERVPFNYFFQIEHTQLTKKWDILNKDELIARLT